MKQPLNLPESLEALLASLEDSNIETSKMSEFVVPVLDAEQQIIIVVENILNSGGDSGKVVMLKGVPGSGKSTFIESLTWRKHVPIQYINKINASVLSSHTGLLENLFSEIQQISPSAHSTKQQGQVKTIVIDYLEDISFIDPKYVKAFFQRLNGFLRHNPILIIWPITEDLSAEAMLKNASAVSGTVFADNPIIEFQGPPDESYPQLAKNTITTLHPGSTLEDFLLSEAELDTLRGKVKQQNPGRLTPRSYLREVKRQWEDNNRYLEDLLKRIPRETQIWFVVCHSEAENSVNSFSRKQSLYVDDIWDAYFGKLYEYVVNNKSNKEKWPESRRLQLAIRGAFKTKVLYIPTHALISSVLAFGKSYDSLQNVIEEIENHSVLPAAWSTPANATRFLSNSALVKLLKREPLPPGNMRSGPAHKAIEKSIQPFEILTRYISSPEGSDQFVNQSLAKCIIKALDLSDSDSDLVAAEQAHPFLAGIRSDILIRTFPDKIICIEMHYTNNHSDSHLANYILAKLDKYMQILSL